jgi:hypothetical protein
MHSFSPHLLKRTQPIFAPAISAGDRSSGDQTSFSREHHAISFNWSMSLGNSPQAYSKRHSGLIEHFTTYWFRAKNANVRRHPYEVWKTIGSSRPLWGGVYAKKSRAAKCRFWVILYRNWLSARCPLSNR